MRQILPADGALTPDGMTSSFRDVLAELVAYLTVFPGDSEMLKPLRQQLQRGEDVCDRRNFNGHICGSGIVLSRDLQKVLLIHHKRFERWQQPGGHAEPGETPLAAAQREVQEETSVRVGRPYLVYGMPVALHIGVHPVPVNSAKDEPVHRHYDFRYLFVSDDSTLRHQEAEVHAAAWSPLDAPETAHVAEALRRLRVPGCITFR